LNLRIMEKRWVSESLLNISGMTSVPSCITKAAKARIFNADYATLSELLNTIGFFVCNIVNEHSTSGSFCAVSWTSREQLREEQEE